VVFCNVNRSRCPDLTPQNPMESPDDDLSLADLKITKPPAPVTTTPIFDLSLLKTPSRTTFGDHVEFDMTTSRELHDDYHVGTIKEVAPHFDGPIKTAEEWYEKILPQCEFRYDGIKSYSGMDNWICTDRDPMGEGCSYQIFMTIPEYVVGEDRATYHQRYSTKHKPVTP